MSQTRTPEEPPVTVLHGYVPVIDLSARDTRTGRASIARAIGQACANSGFFTIVGHGVDQDLVERMYTVTQEFFALPPERKSAVESGPGTCGVLSSGGSAAKSAGTDSPPDLCETFSSNVLGDLGPEQRAVFGDDTAPWTRANQWPGAPEGFKETWLAYTRAMEVLSERLMRLFALALGLGDEAFFDDKIDRNISTIVANYYYPQLTPPLPGQLRKGAHSDWGTLTILYQDRAGGLQVRQEGHGWRDVPFVPGGFVVNIGDMMAFWTGGRWVSTVHRVLNPPEGHTRSRLSIPFFHLPNHDARIEPVVGNGGGEPASSSASAVTPGDWYRAKMTALYS
ncbi:isopenicillin N synthase family dioxygenase [Streptomyces sp. NPDC057638]|uniref:isopenicillin N synthase family dioxygenase n=1 Tax=Streptomyces sp. NPDC057638 TaxID=3346190 RepID=UPI0036B8110E